MNWGDMGKPFLWLLAGCLAIKLLSTSIIFFAGSKSLSEYWDSQLQQPTIFFSFLLIPLVFLGLAACFKVLSDVYHSDR